MCGQCCAFLALRSPTNLSHFLSLSLSLSLILPFSLALSHRYYMERKIFQHLLELKSLQIRSNKLNESVLVKRAVDDYHKSCVLLNGETGTRLRRYTFTEYTFKNFELFLYETLKGLQKPGNNNFQNINEVYEEVCKKYSILIWCTQFQSIFSLSLFLQAERRLSPDYNAYEKALQCTTKTHRCLHAAHAYTGIPCAAYSKLRASKE